MINQQLAQTKYDMLVGGVLSRKQVEALAKIPYEHPGAIYDRKIKRDLLILHLIEPDPSTTVVFRATDLGMEVINAYRRAGWIE